MNFVCDLPPRHFEGKPHTFFAVIVVTSCSHDRLIRPMTFHFMMPPLDVSAFSPALLIVKVSLVSLV